MWKQRGHVNGFGQHRLGNHLFQGLQAVMKCHGVNEQIRQFESLRDRTTHFGMVEAVQVALSLEPGMTAERRILQDRPEGIPGNRVHDRGGKILEQPCGKCLFCLFLVEKQCILPGCGCLIQRRRPEQTRFVRGQPEIVVKAGQAITDRQRAHRTQAKEVHGRMRLGHLVPHPEPGRVRQAQQF